jgi:hypothetical protein
VLWVLSVGCNCNGLVCLCRLRRRKPRTAWTATRAG